MNTQFMCLNPYFNSQSHFHFTYNIIQHRS
ncbi:hypothetical protein F383_21031 [Gossypium arboreum]|uniref:Uncharacterized protein n=1 Tax=Gossypium arboreum TaxID=29729 RepID=A0A0B0P1Z9_GOSAR|nr:hypothetical protein F383_21031 [Gossypium arboreum]